MVQWLGLHAFTAEGMGSIPGRGTKILQATWAATKKKKEKKKRRSMHPDEHRLVRKEAQGFCVGSVITVAVSLQLLKADLNHPAQKQAKELNKHFSKEDRQMANKHTKDFRHHSSSGKCKVKPQ